MISRVERTRFANWWWTVDRLMLAAIAVLIMTGIVLSLAASPAVATRIGLDAFYFVNRHAMYLAPTLMVMIAVSFLSPRSIRRLALVVFIVALAMTAATLVIGAEVKGARRWIVLAGVNIQPSEFVKPAFVILIAWLFAEFDAQGRHSGQHIRARPADLGRRRARAAAGLRPDHADRAGVGRAVLHGRHAHDLGRGPRRHRGGGNARRLRLRAARARTHQPLHGPVRGRQLSGRQRGRIVHPRRLVRTRAGRGHGEAHPARQPCRFRLRGRGRGIRHRAVPRAGQPCSPSS